MFVQSSLLSVMNPTQQSKTEITQFTFLYVTTLYLNTITIFPQANTLHLMLPVDMSYIQQHSSSL